LIKKFIKQKKNRTTREKESCTRGEEESYKKVIIAI
jgi:hypothetical protein